MDDRVQFISDWLKGLWSMTDLAQRYGVSRKTAYKWRDRYVAEGVEGLRERSCAPLEHGFATPAAVAASIVAFKDKHRKWGPLKVISKLKELRPDIAWPAPSTAGEILKRAGLVTPRHKRSCPPPTLGGLTDAKGPNHVWATDHKGWVELGNGRRCEPLTLTDSFSRFLIALERCTSTSGAQAIPIFERAFAEHGLPEVIRSDNGAPFATKGVTGLSALGVWWTKLGIHHERITPGRPQQNGRHERFHLTLLEAMEPPSRDEVEQAARFEAFRQEYNHERPHQALGQTPPARHYAPSPRPLPDQLPEPDIRRRPTSAGFARTVRSNGAVR